jgi:hypothetical protein
VYWYSTVEQARQHVLKCGWKILWGLFTPVTILPFLDSERDQVSTKGNYLCVAERTDG